MKKGEIWQSLIGEPNVFKIDNIDADGWATGTQMKSDDKGKRVLIQRSAFAGHVDTLTLTMKKVD